MGGKKQRPGKIVRFLVSCTLEFHMKGTLPHFSTTVSREHDVNYSEGPREVCSYSELGAASSSGHNGISVSVLSQHQLFSEQK